VTQRRSRTARPRAEPLPLQHAYNPWIGTPGGTRHSKGTTEGSSSSCPSLLDLPWCHVMERESFEDPAAAAVINEVCVPIKVDREERPTWTRCTWRCVRP